METLSLIIILVVVSVLIYSVLKNQLISQIQPIAAENQSSTTTVAVVDPYIPWYQNSILPYYNDLIYYNYPYYGTWNYPYYGGYSGSNNYYVRNFSRRPSGGRPRGGRTGFGGRSGPGGRSGSGGRSGPGGKR